MACFRARLPTGTGAAHKRDKGQHPDKVGTGAAPLRRVEDGELTGQNRDARGAKLAPTWRARSRPGRDKLYRAPRRNSAGSVDIVHGQCSQHGVVCIQGAVDQIIVPASQNDRGGLRKIGGILDGNRHSVASQLVHGEKTDSSYVRASTERARRLSGDIVDVQKPGLAPDDVEPGRDGHRNDVGSQGCRGPEGHGASTSRHVSAAYAARAGRAGRTGSASRSGVSRRPGCSGSPSCSRSPSGTCRAGRTSGAGRPWVALGAWRTDRAYGQIGQQVHAEV